MTFDQRKDFLILLADLLKNGFTLQESLTFMGKILKSEKKVVRLLKKELAKGQPFYESFDQLGFTKEQVAQIRFADIHGNLMGTLETMGKQMELIKKKREELMKVMLYPCILFGFLMMMMLLIKYLLVPQLSELSQDGKQSNWTLSFIQQMPMFLLFTVLLLCLLLLTFQKVMKKFPVLKQAQIKCKIPIYGQIYSHYLTSFFALEWSKLLLQGLELKQIFEVMQTEGNTELMKEMAVSLQKGMKRGKPIHRQMNDWSFLAEGMRVIFKQGEKKGKLGEELHIYGNKIWEQLMKKIEIWLQWLQPIIFLFVALLIVAVYAALLLPLYEGMNGF